MLCNNFSTEMRHNVLFVWQISFSIHYQVNLVTCAIRNYKEKLPLKFIRKEGKVAIVLHVDLCVT